MLLGVDDSLGRILAALERKGMLNDTMVVFTSDHGYFYGEHGLNEERRLAYEETIRIPLVIRYPPLTMAGSTPPEMALSLDIAPTLLEVAGLQPGAEIQGRSLVPVLKKEARDWRDVVPDRVLHRYGVSAHSEHGLRGGSNLAAQVHQLPRASGDGRALRSR